MSDATPQQVREADTRAVFGENWTASRFEAKTVVVFGSDGKPEAAMVIWADLTVYPQGHSLALGHLHDVRGSEAEAILRTSADEIAAGPMIGTPRYFNCDAEKVQIIGEPEAPCHGRRGMPPTAPSDGSQN